MCADSGGDRVEILLSDHRITFPAVVLHRRPPVCSLKSHTRHDPPAPKTSITVHFPVKIRRGRTIYNLLHQRFYQRLFFDTQHPTHFSLTSVGGLQPLTKEVLVRRLKNATANEKTLQSPAFPPMQNHRNIMGGCVCCCKTLLDTVRTEIACPT